MSLLKPNPKPYAGDDRPWLKHYEAGVPSGLVYPDVALSALLQETARLWPQRPATSFFGNTLTYQEILTLSEHFAGSLQQLGLVKGDRIALVLPNCPQFVYTYFGALLAGLVVVPCNPLYTAGELGGQLRDSGATTVVVLSRIYPVLQDALRTSNTNVKNVIVTNIKEHMPLVLRTAFTLLRERKEGHAPKLDAKTLQLSALLSTHAAFKPVNVVANDLALLQYTGGTTGIPKGAMLSHRALIANAMQCQSWFPSAKFGQEVLLALMPFFHVYGLTVGLHVGIAVGAKLVLIPKFEINDLLKTITKTRPTLFPGAPRIYVAINQAPNVAKYDLRSITACLSGSAPLPLEVATQFESLTGGQVVEGYGLTEAAPVTHANPLGGGRKVGFVGLPFPDIECKIIDLDTGKLVATGETGELCLKGPNLMDGYWNQPEETALVLKDGWLHTGDIARMDSEGYFQIVDRKKELIIVNGLKVFPREVDEVLYSHPSVLHAACIGIPDVTHGEVVKAFVVLKEGEIVSAEALKAHCKVHLAKYKVPVAIEIRQELPMTILGKVLRRVLAQEEAARKTK